VRFRARQILPAVGVAAVVLMGFVALSRCFRHSPRSASRDAYRPSEGPRRVAHLRGVDGQADSSQIGSSSSTEPESGCRANEGRLLRLRLQRAARGNLNMRRILAGLDFDTARRHAARDLLARLVESPNELAHARIAALQGLLYLDQAPLPPSTAAALRTLLLSESSHFRQSAVRLCAEVESPIPCAIQDLETIAFGGCCEGLAIEAASVLWHWGALRPADLDRILAKGLRSQDAETVNFVLSRPELCRAGGQDVVAALAHLASEPGEVSVDRGSAGLWVHRSYYICLLGMSFGPCARADLHRRIGAQAPPRDLSTLADLCLVGWDSVRSSEIRRLLRADPEGLSWAALCSLTRQVTGSNGPLWLKEAMFRAAAKRPSDPDFASWLRGMRVGDLQPLADVLGAEGLAELLSAWSSFPLADGVVGDCLD
jgi:hypothetical protein